MLPQFKPILGHTIINYVIRWWALTGVVASAILLFVPPEFTFRPIHLLTLIMIITMILSKKLSATAKVFILVITYVAIGSLVGINQQSWEVGLSMCLLATVLTSLSLDRVTSRYITIFTVFSTFMIIELFTMPGQLPPPDEILRVIIWAVIVLGSGEALALITHNYQQQVDLLREEQLITHRMISNMSHELRTPLNGIMGANQLITREPLTETQSELVDMSQKSATYLLSMINNILDLARYRSSSNILTNTEFSIPELVKEVSDMIRPQLRTSVILQTAATEVPPVLGDRGKLKQVLVNLMANANKFTLGGFIQLVYSITAYDEDTITVNFSVNDSGIGIPKERQDRIFRAFDQGNPDTHEKFGGTGLGLSIVKEILKRMGSDIKLHSVINKGSRFSFEITFTRAEKGVIQLKNESPLKNSNILVVKDHNISQNIMAVLGHHRNLNFKSIDNPHQAYVHLVSKTSPVDLIIYDMREETLEDEQFVLALRDSGIMTPILIITGCDTDSNALTKAIMYGANDAICGINLQNSVFLKKIESLLSQDYTDHEILSHQLSIINNQHRI